MAVSVVAKLPFPDEDVLRVLCQELGGKDSWVFTDTGNGGYFLHDTSSRSTGQQLDTGATIGVGFDSDSGQIWFAKNGSLLQNEYQSTIEGEVFTADDFETLRPVIGVAADCQSPVPVSITVRTKAVDFEFQPWAGFMSLVQDACACNQAHALCLEDGGCLTEELQKTLYHQCIDDGCTKAQCSTTDYMHCSNGDAMDCDAAYFQCSNAIIGGDMNDDSKNDAGRNFLRSASQRGAALRPTMTKSSKVKGVTLGAFRTRANLHVMRRRTRDWSRHKKVSMAETKKQHAFRRGRRDHDDDGQGGPTFTYLDFETPDGCVTASEFARNRLWICSRCRGISVR